MKQLSTLLNLYNDAELSLKLHADTISSGGEAEHLRKYLYRQSSEAPWLKDYLAQELKIKTRSFLTHLEKDYLRLREISKILYILSTMETLERIDALHRRLKSFMVSAYDCGEEVEIATTQAQSVYNRKGFVSFHKKQIDKIRNSPVVESYTLTICVMANNPTTYHTLKSYLTAYGFMHTLPRYEKGRFHKVDITFDGQDNNLRYLVKAGELEYKLLTERGG